MNQSHRDFYSLKQWRPFMKEIDLVTQIFTTHNTCWQTQIKCSKTFNSCCDDCSLVSTVSWGRLHQMQFIYFFVQAVRVHTAVSNCLQTTFSVLKSIEYDYFHQWLKKYLQKDKKSITNGLLPRLSPHNIGHSPDQSKDLREPVVGDSCFLCNGWPKQWHNAV